MPIYKPSELHQFLNDLGMNPKKGLSQNFLIDGNIIRKIASTALTEKGDVVLEIGPGPGSLTEELLRQGAHVVAVEKDAVLANALERLKGADRQLDVYAEDIMKFPAREVLMEKAQGKKVKLVANLPYHLTTPIIAALVPMHDLFSALVVMVQDEVAKRFTAQPGTSEYSSFTVFLNFYCRPKYAFLVSKNCFYPVPKVESAIVVLELREPPHVSSVEGFFEMTRTAFEHRRKMLRGSLKGLYESAKVTEALEKLGLNPLARPEELGLEDFIRLFEELNRTK
jgi:16S rRNA (adenine1518-N6/adenine1519-N6)-dimethyltransferase